MEERKGGMEGGWKKEEGSCLISTCTSENVTKSPDSYPCLCSSRQVTTASTS